MGLLTTEALAKFCIEQSFCFDTHDWLLLSDFDDKRVALVAKYLSMTSWYGHELDLEAIADQIHAFEYNSSGLYCESRQLEFNLPYFSAAVRIGVTRARAMAQCEGAMVRRSRRRCERNRLLVT
ncbi:MAG: hypothetical protein KBD60_08460 [Sterolibacterium sp.]|jgi:hypothetical protein|nr:hypothetical protein [Sterolibacterium sp.]